MIEDERVLLAGDMAAAAAAAATLRRIRSPTLSDANECPCFFLDCFVSPFLRLWGRLTSSSLVESESVLVRD